jgi:hypothetical protein
MSRQRPWYLSRLPPVPPGLESRPSGSPIQDSKDSHQPWLSTRGGRGQQISKSPRQTPGLSRFRYRAFQFLQPIREKTCCCCCCACCCSACYGLWIIDYCDVRASGERSNFADQRRSASNNTPPTPPFRVFCSWVG